MSVFLDGKISFSTALRNNTKALRLTTATNFPVVDVPTTTANFKTLVGSTTGKFELQSAVNFSVDMINSLGQPRTFTKIVLLGQEQSDPEADIRLLEVPLDDAVEFTVDGIFTLNSLEVDYS